MDRRKFIGTVVGGSLLGGAECVRAGAFFPKVIAGGAGPAENGQRAQGTSDLSIREIATQYHADLFGDFLPFMGKYVVDPTYGGFLCGTDGHGVHITTDKYSWFEGRGTWVYSFLYNHLAHEKKYLDVARGSVEFILRHSPKPPEEAWPFRMTREGKPLAAPEPEVYGNLFIAEGFMEYSAATGEPRYWQMARDILLRSVAIYDRTDYYPEIGQTYLGPQARSFPGARIQGVWMVLLRLCTQMLQSRKDPEIEAVAARCVDAVVNHHFNPEFQLNNELLNHDLTRPANEYAQLVYTGHCIETSWIFLEEAIRLGDEKLFAALADRFRRHVEVAEDRVYGGVFRDLMNVNENQWALDKVLWAQEEVTIGALLIFEHTGAPWAWDLFLKFDRYTRRRYQEPLKRLGIPLWIYGADRQVTLDSYLKLPARVENYHHPRHLMLNLIRLNRLAQRKVKLPEPINNCGGEVA